MTVMTDLTSKAATYISDQGWLQNRMEDEAGRVCVAGALRACATTDTDRAVTLAVLRATGHGEEWNDAAGRTETEVLGYLAAATITDDDLTGLLGPNWRHMLDLLRRSEHLTSEERRGLSVGDTDDLRVARHVAQDLVAEHARAAVPHIEIPPLGETISGGLGDALWGLATRDLIGEHGYTREDYTALTSAWTRVAGPAHPDDVTAVAVR